jgi:hypothetical protein
LLFLTSLLFGLTDATKIATMLSFAFFNKFAFWAYRCDEDSNNVMQLV